MRTSIQTAHFTDVGRVREKNEDSVYAALTTLPLAKELGIDALLLVADGVGGHSFGQEASRQAVLTVQELFHDEAFLRGCGSVQDALTRAVELANERVYGLASQEALQKPGTTMTLVALNDSTITISHVGDSRAYLVTSNGWEQLTQDDSYVAEAVRRGQMTAEEARVSPLRNRISKCLGQKPDIVPSESEHTWSPGDIVYLCSDGLSEYVEGSGAAIVFFEHRNLSDACAELVRLANEGGGHDNISVAAAKNEAVRSLKASPTRSFEAPKKDDSLRFWAVAGVLLLLIVAVLAGQITLNCHRAARGTGDPSKGREVEQEKGVLTLSYREGRAVVRVVTPGFEPECSTTRKKSSLEERERFCSYTFSSTRDSKDLQNELASLTFEKKDGKKEENLFDSDLDEGYEFDQEEGEYSVYFQPDGAPVEIMTLKLKKKR